ncbi:MULTISPECIES: sulfite exporter TauE/SafE family protein [Rhizobium]|uniref:Probable membrane transporter protein n=1 Tax=Rhizobium rhododendri TaxID=2506430 RepID=A0ABY8IJV0_9HYPH|nr:MULTISPECIES: sulfite exporter TauE/SafE family protein [Rhizobium]MBZ5760052.1 sulfite exporter TauE/SafE family protein [Rhizobium sp. VS19-DR96]MBZ5766467.1 sulfite exporter TauE/SafE family protein [Rhizobium sp. VS19-DR129.2]MBZ5774190.1 sulfite exporter TauE/SafE family protein [Rhizobium sp. VS19-DRK62.2]MBZ5785262.1 sulfite exporter TauE/SafE family protein [Rhizobium sp. VS19-DR121]MBZ5802861.1 sulfite exporter TauE/SafE family protein [Rhizobium sp. VS19-DR181]
MSLDALRAAVDAWFIASLPAHGLVALVAIALVAGLARGFSGFGAALILIPLGGALIGPRLISPVLLVVDGLATLGMVRPAFHLANRREVVTMAVGAIIGVPLGTAILALMDPLLLRWLITAIAACLLTLLVSGWRYHGEPTRPLTAAVGFIAGLFSGAAQLGGPPVVAFWLGGKSNFTRVRSNIILYFSISTILSVVSYYTSGLFVAQVFALTVVILPSYVLGLYGGTRLFGLARESTFRWICYALIGTSAVLGMPALDGIFH